MDIFIFFFSQGYQEPKGMLGSSLWPYSVKESNFQVFVADGISTIQLVIDCEGKIMR